VNWWKKDEEEGATPSSASKVEERSTASNVSTVGAKGAPRRAVAPSSPTSDTDLEKKYGTVRSALSSGTVIQGKLSFDTPVRIDGSLMGEVFSSSVLIVGPSGSVSADINVETLIVLGAVSGEIKARKRLELHASGELVGNIQTPSLLIEEGAYFEGECSMEGAASQRQEAKKTPTKVVTSDANEDLSKEKEKSSSGKGHTSSSSANPAVH
jgi:cytoskeletal protein CcmA (bactofilin family)